MTLLAIPGLLIWIIDALALTLLLGAFCARFRDIQPIVRLARPGSTLWNWPDSFFDIYLPTLVKMRLITAAHERAFRRAWAERSRDPSAFFTSPPMVEIIAEKR